MEGSSTSVSSGTLHQSSLDGLAFQSDEVIARRITLSLFCLIPVVEEGGYYALTRDARSRTLLDDYTTQKLFVLKGANGTRTSCLYTPDVITILKIGVCALFFFCSLT